MSLLGPGGFAHIRLSLGWVEDACKNRAQGNFEGEIAWSKWT